MSLEQTKWGWKARWREGGLHRSKTFPTKEEAQDFERSANRRRTMSAAQRYAYTRPINRPSKTAPVDPDRAEKIRLELKEQIEQGIRERVPMRNLKDAA